MGSTLSENAISIALHAFLKGYGDGTDTRTYTLGEERVFSSEELDLLTQRINEGLEHALSDILRTWERESKNSQHDAPWRFKGGENFHFRFTGL